MKEIGSEFSAELLKQAHTDLCWIPKHSDIVMTFSGRTAIETALRNIPQKKKALLPAWCCSSIVEPFLNQGMKVSFYPVEIAEEGVQIELQIPEDCDVVLLCRYFGFVTEYPKDRIIDFQKRGGIVIEDITHSLLSYKHSWEHSDYLVASLRKWGAVLDGGFCSSRKFMAEKPNKEPEQMFLEKKQQAMELKAAYLQKEIHDKATYLTLYGQSNELLAEQYADRRMSNKSLDVLKAWDASQMREIRCQNALVLYKGLENISGVNPLFPKEKMDCPLFVPIMVEGNRRDALRQYLIEQEIYCPVHWPVPEGAQSQIYDRELSLVCDQRYSIADMERILTCIRDFMKRN